MAHEDIAQQTFIEHGMLKNITDALRVALAWKQEESDVPRKLSTVRFIAQSLQRHLDHLFALEEYDGYMDVALQISPYFGKQVNALKQEHDRFRQAVPRLVVRLEQVSSTDQTTFGKVCEEVLVLLQDLEKHSRKEALLLQEALGRDGGGEG
jgi:hemerythrin-like domain-containing protein